MQSEAAVREKLEFLETQQKNGNDPAAGREIDRLKWVLEEAPDIVEIPRPKIKVSEAEVNKLARDLFDHLR